MSTPSLAVLAGEASGDRIAASALSFLAPRATSYGVGGVACRRAGVELVAESSELAAMGLTDVVRRAPRIARALASFVGRVRAEPPRAALLVDAAELSARLGPWLRRRGVRVLWCVAPQVWAWRRSRTRSLARAMDHLAVILPFEVAIWRAAGVDATFVGHPALEPTQASRAEVRASLGIDARARAVAVLPGSRAGEIARLAQPLARAAALLRARGSVDRAAMIPAPGLEPRARAELGRVAADHAIDLVEASELHGAAPLLPAFDVALCASGTASLEAALAGATPVVAFRADPLTFAIAKRVVTTPFIALPNVLLGRAAVPELLQHEATATRIADAAEAVLAASNGQSLADELRALLELPGDRRPFGARIAALLEPWLT